VPYERLIDSTFLTIVCLLYAALAVHAGRQVRRKRAEARG
jgi:hypothetical protein